MKTTDYILMHWCKEADQGLWSVHETGDEAIEVNRQLGNDAMIYKRVRIHGPLGNTETMVLVEVIEDNHPLADFDLQPMIDDALTVQMIGGILGTYDGTKGANAPPETDQEALEAYQSRRGMIQIRG